MGDLVMGWLQQHQNIAWTASLIISSGAVWGFMTKYSPKIRKASKVAAKTLELINDVLDASDDKVVTKEEVEKILAHVSELREVLK